ncbi:hypothetical protein LQW54_010659 [Pestalotiopsis sp. IQ-011]
MSDQPTNKQPWSIANALHQLGFSVDEKLNSFLPFFHLLERLKTTKRAGWKRHGIKNGESIADHSWRMAMIAMFAAPAGLDKLRCIQMCLVHDIAESVVGDITPADKVSKEEKEGRERATIDWIAQVLLGHEAAGVSGEQLRGLWDEFERGETAESKFAQNVDKIELLLQMVEYEGRDAENLSEFAYVAQKLSPDMKSLGDSILSERRDVSSTRASQDEDMRRLQDQYYS